MVALLVYLSVTEFILPIHMALDTEGLLQAQYDAVVADLSAPGACMWPEGS
jgi:hypothetical protein